MFSVNLLFYNLLSGAHVLQLLDMRVLSVHVSHVKHQPVYVPRVNPQFTFVQRVSLQPFYLVDLPFVYIQQFNT